MSEIQGIVNIIKPPGMTSFDVVAFVRKQLKIKKVGHTGTLDPAAAGVLPICVGRATKIIPFLTEERKEYIAEFTLGVKTDTLDAEGRILSQNTRWEDLSAGEISRIISEFEGVIEQIPPMYSAVHYQGKRLYELARQGKEVERNPRQVEIKKIVILGIELPRVRIRVICSRGTYIRTLVADIGEKLGCGAYLSFLLRTASGPFFLNKGITLEELAEGNQGLLPLDYPLDFPQVILTKEATKKAKNGNLLEQDDLKNKPERLQPEERVLVYTAEGSFISINKVIAEDDNITLKPLRVFN